MAEAKQIYEDQWGEIIDRPSGQLIELRWFDSTSDMSKSEFEQWLVTFARYVGQVGRSHVLVDGTSFRMNPAFMDGAWRDTNVIPLYNAAGVTRFAFHMPADMPMVGQPPAPEGPASFPTGYFAQRKEALRWLEDSAESGSAY